jgi:hypothetical protein
LKIKASKSVILLLAAFVIVNILIFVTVGITAQTLFERWLLDLGVFSSSVIVFFFIIAKHLIPSAPSGLWVKFAGIVLASIFLYTALSVTTGEWLLSIMGMIPVSVSPEPFSTYELNRLVLLLTGFSYITYGLTYLAIAYFLQKFVVRLVYHAYKLMTGCPNFFFQANRKKKKLSVVMYTLWLILLPFPLQHTLSIGATEVLVLVTAFSLPAMIAVFALWGLGASGLVGTTEDKVFRLSDMLYQSLFWLLVGEWISFIVYVFFTSTDFVLAISTMILLFTRSLFLFAPSAIITAYFYTRFLESRAEAKIVAYLSKKERLVEKVLTISADKKREREHAMRSVASCVVVLVGRVSICFLLLL